MTQLPLAHKTFTELKKETPALLDTLAADRSPVLITQDGAPRAVLQDLASYQQTQATLTILDHIARGERDVHLGRETDQETVFQEIEREFFPDGLDE